MISRFHHEIMSMRKLILYRYFFSNTNQATRRNTICNAPTDGDNNIDEAGSKRMTAEHDDFFISEVLKRWDILENKATDHSLTPNASKKRVNDAWESISNALNEKHGVSMVFPLVYKTS